MRLFRGSGKFITGTAGGTSSVLSRTILLGQLAVQGKYHGTSCWAANLDFDHTYIWTKVGSMDVDLLKSLWFTSGSSMD